jgi:hypothetical protein
MHGSLDPVAERALAINLDADVYGSFAEIGAGQEVARWFFSVGAAAGSAPATPRGGSSSGPRWPRPSPPAEPSVAAATCRH